MEITKLYYSDAIGAFVPVKQKRVNSGWSERLDDKVSYRRDEQGNVFKTVRAGVRIHGGHSTT
jgi:hypothetical protein